MKRLNLIVLATLATTRAAAQSAPAGAPTQRSPQNLITDQNLGVEELQHRAVEHSADIKTLRFEADSAHWQEIKGLSVYLPQLTAMGGHLLTEKFLVEDLTFAGSSIAMPEIAPYTSFGVQASLTIFDGLCGWHMYEAAKLRTHAVDLELRRAEFRLERELRTRFYQVLGDQQLVSVAEQNIKTLQQHLEDVNTEIRSGTSTKYDALRIEVQLGDVRTELLGAQDDLVIARARLFQAANRKDENQSLVGQLPSDWSKLDLEHLQLKAEARQDREAQFLAEQSAGRIAEAARAHWLPRVSLTADSTYYNDDNHVIVGDRNRFQFAYSAGVNIQWSLFDGGASIASDHIAANLEHQAAEKLRALDEQMPIDFQLWQRRLRYSVAVFEAKSAAIRKAEESIRLAKGGVRVGTRTNTEVLDAELDLNQARARVVKAPGRCRRSARESGARHGQRLALILAAPCSDLGRALR